MSEHSVFQKPAVKWGLIAVFWTVLGLCFASQLYLTQSKLGNPVSWRFAAGRSLADWYVFALLSIPALWMARHFRLEEGRRLRNTAIHLAASAAFSLLWMVVRAAIEDFQSRATDTPMSFSAAFSHVLAATFFFNLLIYWVIVSVSHAFALYRKVNERDLRTAELEQRLTQARLQALQMQLNPHFLFNTLHAISALVHEDVELADRMITRLGELLRYALESTDEQEVPLKQELSFLERYLEIEQTRFGGRLSVRTEIEPDVLDARVPNLVLQPLVENAIRHGIEPHARPGEIVLGARRQNGVLELQVRDNGGGLPAAGSWREGVGLANTRVRLEHLYGEAQTFELKNASGGGLVVQVTLPFRRSGEPVGM